MSEEEIPEVDVDLKKVEEFARSNPNNLPPQYNGDPEKFIKSWKDMRSEITRLQQGAKAQPQAEAAVPPAAPIKAPDNLTIPDKPVTPSQDEWNKWGNEISTTGNVSEDTRNAIKSKFGIPDQILDGYIEGVKSRQKELAVKASEVVGGPDELKSIIEWATDNLGEDERTAVNVSLSQPGWQNVLLGLKARRAATNTEPKSKVNGVSGVPAGIKPFANPKEMVTAMRDPRYKFDSEYQAMVQERVRITGVSRNV